jgi:hypothetical protein
MTTKAITFISAEKITNIININNFSVYGPVVV